MPKLNKRTVDALSPRVHRYTEWDDQLAGFGCRVSPDGKRRDITQTWARRPDQ